MTYRLSEEADRDLTGIYDWVAANHGHRVASKVLASIFSTIELLTTLQGMGRERPEILDRPYRFFSFSKNVIIYIPGDVLHVHRIFPVVMDLRNLQR